jgi:hypothetical protein
MLTSIPLETKQGSGDGDWERLHEPSLEMIGRMAIEEGLNRIYKLREAVTDRLHQFGALMLDDQLRLGDYRVGYDTLPIEPFVEEPDGPESRAA